MRNLTRYLCAAIVSVLITLPGAVQACTLWAAAGDSVAGGGTMISKNRDWRPDHQQQIRLITPQSGYRLIALYAVGNSHEGTKAGINEKGLVIVSASPPSYLEVAENYKGGTTMRTLLSRYASVAEALAALDEGQWTHGPDFLVLADGKEIATIEFGLDGAYDVVSRTASGVVYHTNHYLSSQLAALNKGKLTSSLERYDRIDGFMTAKAAFTSDDFRQYSADSILWRSGATPTATRTLASWIVRQAPGKPAVLHLQMANPGKAVAEYEFAVSDLFAGKVDLAQIE